MIPLHDIIALVAGDLADDEAQRVEEHLFGCGTCSAAAAWLAGLGDAVRRLAREGRIDLVYTTATIEQLERDGIRFGRYTLGPGESVRCTLVAGDVCNVAELSADLRGVTRLDGELLIPGGVVIQRLEDVPFVVGQPIVMVSRGDRLREMPATRLTVRLFSVDGDVRRVIADYTLDHYH